MARVLVRIALVLAAVGLAVVSSEGAYRIAREFVCVGRGDVLFTPDAKLGWRHVAGRSGWQHGCLGREFEFRTFVRINSKGLYDVEHAYERTPGVARVLLLGDSITEAMQVPSGSSFADLLEREVTVGGHAVEVINAGTSGYSTDNELLFFREEGRRYRPDLVVLVWNLANDVGENDSQILDENYRGAGLEKPGKPIASLDDTGKPVFDYSDSIAYAQEHAVDEYGHPKSLWQRLKGKLYLLRLIERRLFPVEPPKSKLAYPIEFGAFALPLEPRWEHAWKLTEALVAAMRDEVVATGARFAVIVIPARTTVQPRDLGLWPAKPQSEVSERWDVDYPPRRADAFLRDMGIPFVDVTTALREAQAATGLPAYLSFDPHLSIDGHRRVADAAKPFLEQQLTSSLPSAPPS